MAKKISIKFTTQEVNWLYYQACDTCLTGSGQKDWYHPMHLTWKEIVARQKKAKYYTYWCKTILDAKMLVAAWGLEEYDIILDTRDDDNGEISFVVWCKRPWGKVK